MLSEVQGMAAQETQHIQTYVEYSEQRMVDLVCKDLRNSHA